jgi:MFS family permease
MVKRAHTMLDVLRRHIPLLFANHVLGSFALYGSQPVFAVIAIRVTGSMLAGGVVIALTFVPVIIAAPLASALADRFPRRTLLFLADAGRALAVVVLLFDGGIEALYSATFVLAACNCLGGVARGAVLPSMVPAELIPTGNALLTLAGSIGRVAGPALMGAALEVLGWRLCYVILSACFAIAAATVLGVRAVRPEAPRERNLEYAWGGFRYGFSQPIIRIIFVSSVLYFFAGGAINVLQMTLSERVMGMGATAYGLIMSLWALGLTLGSLGATNAATGGTLRGYISGTALAGAAMGFMGILPQLWYVLALSAVGGFAETFRVVAASTLKQDLTPDGLRGRVFGAFAWVAALSGGLGCILAPRLALLVSLPVGFLIMGVVSASGGLLAVFMASRVKASSARVKA